MPPETDRAVSSFQPTLNHTVVNSSSLLPEIWLVVFPYLTSTDLQTVSLACSSFRYMAQPLLFSVLDVSPFLLSYNAQIPLLRPHQYLKRFLERLEYYKLPHIAHGVRHCWISPYSRSGFPPRNHTDDVDPNLIINAAVEVMPYFTSLTTLSWHCIDIAPQWWNTIHTLPITKLWLNSASVPLTLTSPLPTIHHLDLDQWPWEGRVTDHVSIHEERVDGVSTVALRHVIRPGVIQSISVPRSDTASYLFSILSEATYHLVSLKIPFSSLSASDFISALEHCPSLLSLYIFPPPSDERRQDIQLDAFGPSTLPSLANYQGPYSHVLQFCRQPLQYISLWGFDERPSLCNPDALTETLMALAGTSSVDSLKYLELMVTGITHDLLEVLSSFNRLERIFVQSQESSTRDLPMPHHFDANAPINSLYTTMGTITLSPRIKHVKFLTRLTGRKLDRSGQEYDVASFMESFASRHPSIQRMEIEYGIYWTGAYSAVWGRIRENSETSASLLAEAISKTYLEGGYSSKSSSKEYIMSTVVSTVRPLPLGKLTFTEHRRRILFPQDTIGGPSSNQEHGHAGERRFWTFFWVRFRRLFGKPSS